VRGHRWNTQAGRVDEAHALWQTHRVIARNNHILGACSKSAPALRLVEPDPLAHARGWHVCANRIDHTGAILVRNDTREGHLCLTAPAGATLGI
jgi:hypothetical protein